MNKEPDLCSPITQSDNVSLLKSISVEQLCTLYKNCHHIDVSGYFKNISKIRLYQCNDTGYKFYFPFHLEGDSDFYESLQGFPWYYEDWKWEHEVSDPFINPGDTLLEIGCGRGAFLSAMRKKGVTCTGLELNNSAVATGREDRLNIINQSVFDHVKENNNAYDVVCLFQVLEHIAHVKGFIQTSVDLLKPGGKLIISVPNNVKNSLLLKNNPLNMPPHHAGLWNSASLISLQKHFNIILERLEIEPAQKNHLKIYRSHLRKMWKKKIGPLSRFVKIPFSRSILLHLSPYIVGHTILAQYTKTG